jgi:allophanate hydrolase subunit 1
MTDEWGQEKRPMPEEFAKQVLESTHPEMQDIQPGQEFMVVNFDSELHRQLKKRMDELKEDDDNNDGGLVVRV